MPLHDDEVPVTVDDVRRLVAAQHPHWAHLPVSAVAESGTDHLLFRLGEPDDAHPFRWSVAPWLPGAAVVDQLEPGAVPNLDPALAVSDWGALGVGDPAADLAPAWWLFAGRDREAFREASGAGPGGGFGAGAWQRGRGWVLVQGVLALPYYWERWPAFARASQCRIAAVASGA